MNIEHEMVINAFILEEMYNDVEKAYSFSEKKSEIAAFAIFIDELLEKHGLVEFADSYVIKDEEIDDIEDTFISLGNCEKAVGKKPRIDIYDKDNDEYRVYTYLESDEEEIEKVLSLSALKYYINDGKRLQEIEDNLEEILGEYKEEAKLSRDPYAYYGVSRRDFY